MTYFQRFKQTRNQWLARRRNGRQPTGTVVLHTYEAPYNRTPEAGAKWLTQRTDPGSYHALTGSRSTNDWLQLAPWSAETWHETTVNNWAVGISAMAYAAQWKRIPKWAATNHVKSMAAAAASFAKWLKSTRGITIPAKRISRRQAVAGRPGFIGHGDIDRGRRTDPGKHFPWRQFLKEYARLMGTSAPSKPSKSSKKGNPYTPAIDGDFGPVTKKAIQWALRKAGYTGHAVDGDFGAYSIRSLQRMLRKRGQKGHAIDGDFGSYTVRSLQRWLRKKGHKGHAIDGSFGAYTIRSLQSAIRKNQIK